MSARKRRWEEQGVAAHWVAGCEAENPPVRTGRPPKMTYLPWSRNGGVDLGMTGQRQTWWRCRTPHCRRFCGPYVNGHNASRDGYDHVGMAHPRRAR